MGIEIHRQIKRGARSCIEDPMVIETTAWMQEVEQRTEQLPEILTHLNKQNRRRETRSAAREPRTPQAVLFDAT